MDLEKLEKQYFDRKPDFEDANQFVAFGTSGHRGTSLNGTFTEAHVLAITQAICDYRRPQGTSGPLYMGKDTHALSGPAQRMAHADAFHSGGARGFDTVLGVFNNDAMLGCDIQFRGGDEERFWIRLAPVHIISGILVRMRLGHEPSAGCTRWAKRQ